MAAPTLEARAHPGLSYTTLLDSTDPALADIHGEKFKEIYQAARAVTSDPAETLERIYVSVAGGNFRMDGKRANAAFAVVSYFFDSCHIFESPLSEVWTADAPAN